jgi:cytoskeletal protein CcmA (bactofilin family)
VRIKRTKPLENIEQISQFQKGTIIEGSLYCLDNCFFNGKIDGSLKIDKRLVLGEDSFVSGEVVAENIIVKGRVIANMIVENALVLFGCSNVSSKKISTYLLEIQANAVLNAESIITNSLKSSIEQANNENMNVEDNSKDIAKSNTQQHNEFGSLFSFENFKNNNK